MNEIMMNYEESQEEHDDEENDDEHVSVGVFKTLEKDANESSNSESLRYNNNNSDEIDQEAEINSLYISQNDEKFSDQNNSVNDREKIIRNKSDDNNDDGDDEDEENDDFETKNCKNDKYSTRKGTNDWGSCKQQNNEENMSKSNKRRKPHNPQKLSTPEDLASSGKTESLLKSEKNNDEQNNNLTDKE